jgi:hypothetical protein
MITECVSEPNPHSDGYLIAAKPRWRIGTIPHKKNNLRSITLRTRLIPAGTGDDAAFRNWTRNWHSFTTRNVSADGPNDKHMWLTSESQSNYYDWDVQIDIKWDRRHKRDWHFKTSYGFNEGFCATDGGF